MPSSVPSSSGSGSSRNGNLQRERSGSSFSVAARQPTNVYAGSGGVLGSSYASSYINGTLPGGGSFSTTRQSFGGNQGNVVRGSFVGNGPNANSSDRASDLRQDIQGINKVLAQSKGSVKGGAAGAFNPAIFSGNGRGDPGDGDFVDRTTQELMIEQKLIPIDESTVMQEIIDDRHTEIVKVRLEFLCSGCLLDHNNVCFFSQIHKGLVELNEMFTDLSRMVKEQEVCYRRML